jgi:hypothetical protein
MSIYSISNSRYTSIFFFFVSSSRFVLLLPDDRHEYCAFEIDSNSSIPVVIRDGRAPTLALRAISRPTNAATVPLPGVSFQIQIASSLPWIDSDESFGALCVELDAVLLRAPLTLFALELNGALRFESHSHQIADEALFNRVSCSGLVSGAAMRAAMLPPTSRVVVEPFAGGRAYPFNASVTVIIHQTADIAVAAPFAIEFFSRGAPACGVLADAAHRAALSSALSQFSNHGVSFRLLNAAESVAEPQLFAHYRDESGAQIVGLVPGCAVEVVVDLHASASLLPSRLYGGDLFGVVVRRALGAAFDAVARRQPLLLASAHRAMERKAIELASIALAMQAVQSQSRSPLLAPQLARLGANDAAHLLRPLCQRLFAEAHDDSAERLLALTLARTVPHADVATSGADSRHSRTASTNASTTLSMYETDDNDSM